MQDITHSGVSQCLQKTGLYVPSATFSMWFLDSLRISVIINDDAKASADILEKIVLEKRQGLNI